MVPVVVSLIELSSSTIIIIDKTITIKINTNNNNFNKISLIKFFNYLIQQICEGSGFRSFRFFQMNKTKQFITL